MELDSAELQVGQRVFFILRGVYPEIKELDIVMTSPLVGITLDEKARTFLPDRAEFFSTYASAYDHIAEEVEEFRLDFERYYRGMSEQAALSRLTYPKEKVKGRLNRKLSQNPDFHKDFYLRYLPLGAINGVCTICVDKGIDQEELAAEVLGGGLGFNPYEEPERLTLWQLSELYYALGYGFDVFPKPVYVVSEEREEDEYPRGVQGSGRQDR